MVEPGSASGRNPGFYRLTLGSFGVIALHDGTLTRDRPSGFVRNAGDDEVGEALAVAGMARDKLTLTFTALAIETGTGVVLIDTGMGESGPAGTGLLVANLAAAGVQPADVSHVLISHFHGDHISGLRRKDGSPTFPKAEVWVPQAEWDHWTDEARKAAAPEGQKPNFDLVGRMFGPIASGLHRFAPGDEVLPGITAVQANGHTPGMVAFDIVSDGQRMMFAADITNNPMLFVRHPEWQAAFDMAPDTATATRRRLLDRAADERLLLSFFHAPFPGLGYVVRNGAAYEYLPALWQSA